MSFPEAFHSLSGYLNTNPLIQRLFFASIEITALAFVVAVLVRVARIKSPRVIALLWLLVLVKPVASLVVGSVVPVSILPSSVQTSSAAVEGRIGELVLVEPTQLTASSNTDSFEGRTTAFRSHDSEFAPRESIGQSSGVSEGMSPPLLLGLWSVGVLVCLINQLLCRFRVRRLVRSACAPSASVADEYREVGSVLGRRNLPRVLVTDVLECPALVGLVRPTVLLPSWLATEAGGEKFKWCVLHELTHWKSLDHVVLFVRDIAATLFFFHPVVWWAKGRLVESLEFACDRAVLRDEEDAAVYAQQLYEVLLMIRKNRRPVTASGLFATRTQVGRRLAAILEGPLGIPQVSFVATVALVLFAAFTLAFGGAIATDDSVPVEKGGSANGTTTTRDDERHVDILVVHRKSGAPLSGVVVSRRVDGEESGGVRDGFERPVSCSPSRETDERAHSCGP